MSGETEEQVSGWTTDTLHSHMLGLLSQIDLRYSQDFTHLRRVIEEADKRYEQRFQAQQREVVAALAGADKATKKAELASEKRFEGVNEFRAALQDATARNLSRVEYDAAHTNLVDLVNDLKSRFERYEARATGTTAGAEGAKNAAGELRGLIIAQATLVVAALGVAVAIIVATR